MEDSTTIDRNCKKKQYIDGSELLEIVMEILMGRLGPPPSLLIINDDGKIQINPAACRVPSYAKKEFFPSVKVEKITVQDRSHSIKYTDHREIPEDLQPGHRAGELRIRNIPTSLIMHPAVIQKRRGHGYYKI